MTLKTTVKAAVLILSLSLFLAIIACGELDTPLFSSGGTYQVKALVNGNSLESCSLIRRNDKIIPYFAVSVVNDPDLTGLLVYLQNSDGEIVGDRVLYTIEPVDGATQSETPQSETVQEKTASENKEPGEPEDGTNGEEGESETTGQPEPALPKQIMEKRVSLDTNTKPAVKNYDTVILIKSFKQEMPYFPLPKNMEIGQYRLVFEAVGRNNILSLTELEIFYLGSVEFRLNDISMFLPGLSDTRLIPPGVTVMLEAGLDFDSRLNPYVIWYNGKNIISEGNISEGAGNILWKAPEQSGFYSLRLEVLPYQLKRNFTGVFREITLPVSAKASPTGYFFGNAPDYHAKRPLVMGTAYPEQVKLVAEWAAAQAAAAQAAAAQADSAETAADDKPAPAPAPIPPTAPELLRWYRFDGSLDEASLIPERIFENENEKTPLWAAAGQSYGLSVGPDDTYSLRPVSFFRKGEDQGGGIFLFYIKPVAEGTVFNAFFRSLASASDGVWMDMTARENAVTLRLKTRGTTVEMPVNPGYTAEQGLIPIVVEFYIRPYRFEAKLSTGEDLFIQSVTEEIMLTGALSGEGRIKLGADKTAPAAVTAAAAPVSTPSGIQAGIAETKNVFALPNLAVTEKAATTDVETTTAATETAAAAVIVTNTVKATATIWDEFAILYSATPLLPEEIINEDTPEPEEEVSPSTVARAILPKKEALTEQKQTETGDTETASHKFIQ